MKTILHILLLCSIAPIVFAQTTLKDLEKQAKKTQKKQGKKSLAYADALVNLAEAYQENENWAKAKEQLMAAGEIIKYPSQNPAISAVEKSANNFYYVNWKGAFLQGKRNAAEVLPSTWFFNNAYYNQPEKIQALIKLVYTKENLFSNEGYAYWAKAKKVYEENSRDYIIQINALYTILANKAVEEFGKDSEEHIGVLFGQANYNKRKGDKQLAAALHQKVDALYSRTFLVEEENTMEQEKEEETEKEATAIEKRTNVSPSQTAEKEEIPAPTFTIVERMPRFFGCESEKGNNADKKKCSDMKLMGYIGQNITYPDKARENGIEGTVIVQFTVSEYGHIYDIKVIREINEDLAAEVLRLMDKLNELPFRWIAGRHSGKEVRVKMNMPVRFRLN